jgi:hypothetical protein
MRCRLEAAVVPLPASPNGPPAAALTRLERTHELVQNAAGIDLWPLVGRIGQYKS